MFTLGLAMSYPLIWGLYLNVLEKKLLRNIEVNGWQFQCTKLVNPVGLKFIWHHYPLPIQSDIIKPFLRLHLFYFLKWESSLVKAVTFKFVVKLVLQSQSIYCGTEAARANKNISLWSMYPLNYVSFCRNSLTNVGIFSRVIPEKHHFWIVADLLMSVI